MRGPKPAVVVLSEKEYGDLMRLAQAHGTAQQVAQRARVIMAAGTGMNHAEVARACRISLKMARLWRQRWLGLRAMNLTVAERLTDAPRPGAPAHITAAQICQMQVLACEAPTNAGRPISQWTGREIADELIQRGIVPQISRRHAARLLKKGVCNRTDFAIGSLPSLIPSAT